jgi:hypothetical protein
VLFYKEKLFYKRTLFCRAFVQRKKILVSGEKKAATYRVAKTHRIPYLYRSFSAKEPYV